MPTLLRDEQLPGGKRQTIWGLCAWRADATPDVLAFVDEDRTRLTFGQYRDLSITRAAELAARGIGPGTVVAWQLPTWLETLITCAALARLGAVQVPILPMHREREVGHILDDASVEFLMVPTTWGGFDYQEFATALRSTRPDVEVVTVEPGLTSSAAPVAPIPAAEPSDPDEVRWIFYTSGTTGPPKGARHTDGTLIAAGHSLRERYALGENDRGTLVFPITHVGGPFMLVSGLTSGAAHVVTAQFRVEEAIPLLQEEGVTFPGSGTAFEMLYLSEQRKHPGVPLLPLARAFPHGGDTKRPHIHLALRQEIGGVGILSGYGMTEFPMIASGDVTDTQERLDDRIGRLCPGNQIKIVDPGSGQVLGAGEEGEILARGPALCHGYVGEHLNEGAFDDQGFLKTGDVGYIDAHGYVEVTGRLKDIVIRKGEKISATELEDLFATHPSIAEVAIIGLPDDERGELCCAVLVLRSGAEPVDLVVLREFVTGHGLPVYMSPEQLEIRTSLPRDFFGKIKKVELRKELTT